MNMLLTINLNGTKRNLRPVDYSRAFEKMKLSEFLLPDEQKLFDALCLVDTKSYYGEMILDVFRDYTVLKFRELIEELLSQRDDNSYAMYKILGKNAYDCLLTLKKSL